MTLRGRPHVLALLAIAVVALLASDKLVFTPLLGAWKARAARIADLKKSINQGGLLLQREQAIRNRWDSMRTNTLPDDASAAENELLKAFERWSQDSRISVSGIKPARQQVGEDYRTLECRADASGGIEALARFLYNVEKDPLALKVEAVEITSRDNEGQQLSLALQVSGLLLNPQTP